MRNLGVAIGHSMLAYRSLVKGLNKITLDHKTVKTDLNAHWEVLAEAVQTVMRRYGLKNPYEEMKALTRGQKITKQVLQKFIKQLEIPEKAKQRLLKLTPENYLGKACELTKELCKLIS